MINITFIGNLNSSAEFEFRAKKRIGRSNSANPGRFETDLAEAVKNNSVRKRVNIQNGKVNYNPKIPKNSASSTVNSVKKAGKIGSFLNKNKVGLGIGAGVLATGLIANQIRKSKTKKNNLLSKFS